ncbi:MAG TPA: TRAP transporter TatT component family protein [Burkholderiales bacterium]|nr:TRAP transporter TatT component family protein [Burkholderiales bacterium]
MIGNFSRCGTVLLVLLLPTLLGGCSIRQVAVDRVGDALEQGGTAFASDDDPELVRAATPFGLKLIDGLLDESPRHRGLLLAAARGYAQFAYAFVQQDAEHLEADNAVQSRQARARAQGLYRRARDYGLRGLELDHPGIAQELRRDPVRAVAAASRRDVPLLFWTAASWGALIALSKDDPETLAAVPVVEAMADRALALDEGFEHGAIHTFLISYEMARPGGRGDAADRARGHFERAMAMTSGRDAAPFVAFAEAVCVPRGRRSEFHALLDQAVGIDPDKAPANRLANLVAQQRARWLLSRIDDLFNE